MVWWRILVLDCLEEQLGAVGVRLLATFDNRCVDVNSELPFGKWDRELCFINLEVVEVVVRAFVQWTGLINGRLMYVSKREFKRLTLVTFPNFRISSCIKETSGSSCS